MNTLKHDLGQLLSELEQLIRNESFFLIPAKLSEIYALAMLANREQQEREANKVLSILN